MSDSSRVEDLLCAALEKSTAEERAAYLDEACRESPDLRRAVERLLVAHGKAGEFLEKPPSDLLPTAALGMNSNDASADSSMDLVGTSIGPYKLLEQIGEGGMGVVYMADQQAPLRRRVALKVIKPGLDTRQVIARFEAERQALALMDHTNIARVLDAGTTEAGYPYFVMELVRGVPITDYCDANNLPIHDRLELFAQACQAVQHAHQKGIIHRDLKPSNVLVTMNDGRAVPKVIDFGVAKATNQQLTAMTLFTNFAQMIGTPLYMSPEQAEMSSLDIDTRSDIYSLGVLLYELLTGTTPFDRQLLSDAAFDEVRRIIRNQVPPLPSLRISTLGQNRTIVATNRRADPQRLSQLVKGDLDWIVMKSLEKDRTRRYETATGLAADIKRYLLNQAVEACPPSAVYRFRKFAARNRVVLATTALVFTALLLGTIISSWQAIRATHAEHLAEAARTAEAEQRQKEHAAKLLAEEQRAIATRKTEEAVASAEREKQAQQEANQQRDKGLLLALHALVQTTDERIAQAELLWKTGPQAKEEALAAIRTAARLRRKSADLMTTPSELDDVHLDELRVTSAEQETRLTRIASKWLSCVALAKGPTLRASKGTEATIVSSPQGTRLAIVNDQVIEVLSNTGDVMARVPTSDGPYQARFLDESQLIVQSQTEHLQTLEYTIPGEPTTQALLPRMRIGGYQPPPTSRYSLIPVLFKQSFTLSNDRYDIIAVEKWGVPSECQLSMRTKLWHGRNAGSRQIGKSPKDTVDDISSNEWIRRGKNQSLLRNVTSFVPDYSAKPALSPDGKTLLFVTDTPTHSLGMIDIRSGLFALASAPRSDVVEEAPRIAPAAFSNDALPTILPFDGGCYTFDSTSDGAFPISRWNTVVPPYFVSQLDKGKKVTALNASSGEGICLGFANGQVMYRGRQLTDEWSTAIAHGQRGGLYTHRSFIGSGDEILVLRSQVDEEDGGKQERVEICRASDGAQLPCATLSELTFIGTAGEGRFMLYARDEDGKQRIVLFDAVKQRIVKEFDGHPENVTNSRSPTRVMAITSGEKSSIQFWKLPDITLLGEASLSADNGQQILFDEAESCAVVLQGPERSNEEGPLLFREPTIIRFAPYSAIKFKGELKLPNNTGPLASPYRYVPFMADDDCLVMTSVETNFVDQIKAVTSLNLKEHSTRTAMCDDAILQKSMPRFLAKMKGGEELWELFDAETMTPMQRYMGVASSDRVSTTHFVVEDGTKSHVYRWADGQEDPSYGSFDSIDYFSERFQLGHTSDGAFCLATNDGQAVPLGDGTQDLRPYALTRSLSDNGATFITTTGLWDAHSGKSIANWEYSDCWGMDTTGQRALVRVKDGGTSRLRVYDLRTGTAISDVPLDGYPTKRDQYGVKWGLKSNRLAISTNRGLDLLDSSSGKLIKSISYRAYLEPVKRFAAREHLPFELSASDGVVMAWRKADGEFQQEMYRTTSTILDLDLSADGQGALILLADGTLMRRSLAGETLWQFTPRDSVSAGFSARFVNGDHILLACRDGVVRRLSAQDGTLTATCKISEDSLKAVAVAPSRAFAFIQTNRDEVHRFNVARWSVTESVGLTKPATALCAGDDTTCFAGGEQIDAWSLADGTRLWSIEAVGTPVSHLAYQCSDQRLITVDTQGRSYAFCLKDLSDSLTDLGLSGLRDFDRTLDERQARAEVDKLYNILIFSDQVIAAIEKATDWSDAMRTESLAYARNRARTLDEIYAEAWHPLDRAEARRIARALCRREPQTPKFRRLLALTHWKAGEPDETLNVLGAVGPDDFKGLMIQRLAQLALDDETAVRRTSEILRLCPVPRSSDTDWELADLNAYLNDALTIVADRGYEACAKYNWTTAAIRFSLVRDLGLKDFGELEPVRNSMAMVGKWREAADMYRTCQVAVDKPSQNLWKEAVLRAAAGDEEGYRTTCGTLLKVHPDTSYPVLDHMVAFACSIGDRAGEGADKVIALAMKAANSDPRSPLSWTILGAAQYRAGQTIVAIATLKKAMALSARAPHDTPERQRYVQFVQLSGEVLLAMAYHREGDGDALTQQLVLAKASIARLKESKPIPDGDVTETGDTVPWIAPLCIELAERELAKLEAPATKPQ